MKKFFERFATTTQVIIMIKNFYIRLYKIQFLYFVDFSVYRNFYIRSYKVASESVSAHFTCGMLFGAMSERYDEIVELTAFEDFISFDGKGKKKV